MAVSMFAFSLAGGLLALAMTTLPDVSHRQEVERWRAKHEADYRREYVGLAGLFPLKPGPNSAGSASTNDLVLPKSAPATVGRFVLSGDRVRFEPHAGVKVELKGKALTAPVDLKDDDKGS